MIINGCQAAEDKAVTLLREGKYTILARNIKFYGVEIDIITKKADAYIFFEVKRTQKKHYYSLFPTISHQQKKRYHQSINQWYEDIQKFLTVSIGLLVFDEKLNLIAFHKNLEQPT